MNIKLFEIHPEVHQAQIANIPVVALESTIITHGMPFPQNLETANKVENTIRNYKAIPATIAIIDGKIKVGLTSEELNFLAENKNVYKISSKDLPISVTKRFSGGTTVAATMLIAEKAGITIFVTGGIGGVHRGADKSYDISADLSQLQKSFVAVVCAGIKSILDIGSTLEVLETFSVPVLGFQTNIFPGFYTQDSGFEVEYQVDSARSAAEIINAKKTLDIPGGILIANPIPKEYSMDKAIIDDAINQSLIDAQQKGIKGKNITPYLLSQINEITGKDSLESNIQLILNNAKVGAQIAVELCQLPK